MIKERKVYTAICDKCGKDISKDSGYAGWSFSGIVWEMLDYEWVKINGKHYCPDCYEYDEEIDDNKVKE